MLFEILSVLSFIFSYMDTSKYWYMWLIGSVLFAICAIIRDHFD